MPSTDARASVDDTTLVERVAAGDADALQGLYERYGRIVYSFAYRFTRDPGMAEECTQDVFVVLWRRASTYDPARAKLTTWLLTITRNRAIELVRQRSRRPEPVAEAEVELADAAPDPSDLTADADRSQRVAGALAELPPEQREVVSLAYFEGLSHTEIAELIEVPLGTVKGRMRLALERLRALVDDYDLRPEHP
jgi:RNA polymerase sigma factor (sigma-70 family)